jgi:hypothetical protein
MTRLKHPGGRAPLPPSRHRSLRMGPGVPTTHSKKQEFHLENLMYALFYFKIEENCGLHMVLCVFSVLVRNPPFAIYVYRVYCMRALYGKLKEERWTSLSNRRKIHSRTQTLLIVRIVVSGKP